MTSLRCKDGVNELSLVDVHALASTDAAGAARTAAAGRAALTRAAHVSTAMLQTRDHSCYANGRIFKLQKSN